jgi:hypothetical protein
MERRVEVVHFLRNYMCPGYILHLYTYRKEREIKVQKIRNRKNNVTIKLGEVKRAMQ